MSDNVVVLNQLKHIKSTFTKKFEELSANMEVMQSAVQYLSQNIVTINEKLETLQYSLSASLEYYQPSTMSSDPHTVNYSTSTKKKVSSHYAPKMNPYVEITSASLECSQNEGDHQPVQPPPT
ncbi:uncharacterized protein [Dysidea avara]|uniref:uncharacterized protein n=1 Tax=Dysidea avara TaxID=196820 RepID=UPI00332AEB14